MIYNFNYRKGYGSQEYLIEIFNFETLPGFRTRQITDFLDYLLNALKEISPKTIGVNNVWMNDEIWIEINTNYGKITVSVDIWDMIFIMPEENRCIEKIYELLKLDANFNDTTNELINTLEETIFYLNKSNDSIYSMNTVEEIKIALKESISKIKKNEKIDKGGLEMLFAPTGAIQETAIDNGWGEEYLKISENIDKLL